MRVFLIRHGRQSDARCNVDVGLAEEGRQQAALTGHRMSDWGIRRIISSDLIRARQTAEIMNEHLGVPHQIVPELREISFGEMEGLTDAEIAVRFAGFKRRQDALDLDLRYPGGENAADLLQRVVPAVKAIVEAGEGPVAIATHGGVIRTLVSYVTQAPLARWRLVGTSLENGSITELAWKPGAGTFSLERFNDHAHLEAYPALLRAAWGVDEN
ncbi:MAG: histidine phosphatase family protein [Propioniciclava sp.]|uniref:histidine phosphatase family protein n=1 Tax=Propioniciclava sp. TaxID=2038686 RepID=UPI0039E32504